MVSKGVTFASILPMIMFICKSSSESFEQSCQFGTFGANHIYCFEPHMERTATFECAKAICAENNGNVAVIDSPMTQGFLSRLAIKAKYDNFWVNNSDSEAGVCEAFKIGDNYELIADHCDQNFFHICEFEVCYTERSQCQEYGGKFYEIARSRSTFSHAQKSCRKNGGSLAVVNNIELNQYLTNLITHSDWWVTAPQSTISKLNFSDYPTLWAGAKYLHSWKRWQSSGGPHASLFYEFLFGDRNLTSTDICVNSNSDQFDLSDCEGYNYFFCEYPPHVVRKVEHLVIMGYLQNATITVGVLGLLVFLGISLALCIMLIKSSKRLNTKHDYKRLPHVYITSSPTMETSIKPY